jgi:FkbM family methyltransferase
MSEIVYNMIFDAINLIRIDILGNLSNSHRFTQGEMGGGVIGEGFWTSKFIRLLTEQPDTIQTVYEMLEDNESKSVYASDIRNRILQSYFPSFLSDEIANRHYTAKEHRKDLIEYKSNLKAFHSGFDAGDVLTFVKKQYFIPEICEPSDKNIIFDIGAFNGATAICFADHVGLNGKVYSFEPVPEYFDSLRYNTRNYSNIVCMPIGFSNRAEKVQFNINEACAGRDINGTIECEMTTIDEFVEKDNIKVDMIKMDIEGEELKALYGAVKTIEKYKPKLAICIYHNGGEDMLTVPLALYKLNLGYKFYIRKFHMSIQETVLFAC